MSKKATLFVSALAVLTLIGAGCNQLAEQEKTDDTVVTSTPVAATDSFALTAKATTPGRASFHWTIPADMNKADTFRVLNGSVENPTMVRAYWDQFSSDKSAAEFAISPTGSRHFRVCVFDLTKNNCIRYSNDLQLEIK